VLVGLLLLFAVGVAAAASLTAEPYSVRAPKRILLHHVFSQQPNNGSLASDHIVIGGSDVVGVEDALDLGGLQRLRKSHRDWQVGAAFWGVALCNMLRVQQTHVDLVSIIMGPAED